MKFHKIEMVGEILLQKLSSLPVFSSSKEGRILYNQSDDSVYINTADRWKKIGGGTEISRNISNGGTFDTGYLYGIDTTTSPLSGSLYTTPLSGDVIGIYDENGTFSLNNFKMLGGSYNISGSSHITFSTDNAIAWFYFTGYEWKVDIGGRNVGTGTTTPSGSLDYSSLTAISVMDGDDSFVLYDITDSLNKKISLTNWLKNLNINSILSTLTTAEDTDYLLVYDTSDGENKKLAVGSLDTGTTGIDKINVISDDMSLDDTDLGTEFGSVFDIYKTIDFPTTEDGSCWFWCKFPTGWDTSSDLNINLIYSLSGNDPSKTVRLDVSFWSLTNGDVPDSGTPDTTISNDISTSSDNIGKYYEESLTAIDNSNLDSGIKSFAVKLTRDVSEDAYSGTLQIIGIEFSQ